jgi:uncharacterized protein (DUF486 family)
MTYLPTVVLLLISNTFMTFAWYGHLRFENVPLWKVILVSWGIAFFEYVFQVPANRIGNMRGMSGGQLKITQEVITLVVFVVFARLYLGERLTWNYYVAFALILAAVFFVFAFRAEPTRTAQAAHQETMLLQSKEPSGSAAGGVFD